MGARGSDPDRYLADIGGWIYYVRRVPKRYLRWVKSSRVKTTLNTQDWDEARTLRDQLENEDRQYWQMLARQGGGSAQDRANYEQAIERAKNLNFTYHPAKILAQDAPLDDLLARIETLEGSRVGELDAAALLGTESEPETKISEALEIYISEIKTAFLASKSPAQRKSWEKVKRRAVANYIRLNGDGPISKISREQARKVRNFWNERISLGEVTGNSGNRDMGNLRVLWRDYHDYIGLDDVEGQNPFRNYTFPKKQRTRRPPFSTEWIENCILQKGALDDLVIDARLAVYVIADNGMRPSEVVNCDCRNVHINSVIPYVEIVGMEGMGIKTDSSERFVPLVGLAREAMALAYERQNGVGPMFPQYYDKSTGLSNYLMDYFRSRNLLETPDHKIYSFRHSFSDRLLKKKINDKVRYRLLGHGFAEPDYGDKDPLEATRAAIAAVALKYDPQIFDDLRRAD